MGAQPPKDVPPARLFRSLLRVPRPIDPITHRLDAAPTKRLHVRALTHAEWEDADGHAGVVAAALVDAAGAPLLRVEDLGHLTVPEFDALNAAVFATLHRISPTSTMSDVDAWGVALRQGAAENIMTTFVMGTCLEQVGNMSVGAPEKFFGLPRGALLDGHWMAFRAARDVYEQRRPKG